MELVSDAVISDMIRAGLINNQQISWTNLLVIPYQRDTCNTTKIETAAWIKEGQDQQHSGDDQYRWR
jgi:hypothetical protein